jgi:hypothetical protein
MAGGDDERSEGLARHERRRGGSIIQLWAAAAMPVSSNLANSCDVKIVLVDGVSLRNRLQHSSRGNGGIFRLLHSESSTTNSSPPCRCSAAKY